MSETIFIVSRHLVAIVRFVLLKYQNSCNIPSKLLYLGKGKMRRRGRGAHWLIFAQTRLRLVLSGACRLPAMELGPYVIDLPFDFRKGPCYQN